MPVEIRELIIKTTVSSADSHNNPVGRDDIEQIKKQMLEEFKRIVAANAKKNIYKR